MFGFLYYQKSTQKVFKIVHLLLDELEKSLNVGKVILTLKDLIDIGQGQSHWKYLTKPVCQ